MNDEENPGKPTSRDKLGAFDGRSSRFGAVLIVCPDRIPEGVKLLLGIRRHKGQG
jgi:hypothetical protein